MIIIKILLKNKLFIKFKSFLLNKKMNLLKICKKKIESLEINLEFMKDIKDENR